MKSLTGRPLAPEMEERIKARYQLIGGKSPLVDYALSIGEKIAIHLTTAEGESVPVEVGMVHTAPYIDDAVDDLVTRGVTRIIAVSMSPFYSTASNGKGFEAAADAVDAHEDIELLCAPEIGLFKPFAQAHADAMQIAFEEADAIAEEVPIIFSAHSLPMSDVEAGDYVYEQGLRGCADSIAEILFMMPSDEEGYPLDPDATKDSDVPLTGYGTRQLPRPWTLAFQSQGMRGGEWLGPSLKQVLNDAENKGTEAVMVVPLGFSTDHMETLYDLDIETKERCENAHMKLIRTAAPNDSEHLIEAFVASIASIATADSFDEPEALIERDADDLDE